MRGPLGNVRVQGLRLSSCLEHVLGEGSKLNAEKLGKHRARLVQGHGLAVPTRNRGALEYIAQGDQGGTTAGNKKKA